MNRPEHTTASSLGLQVIEGGYAQGKEMTATFPSCVLGDDRPLASVTELWVSPDSKVNVLSKTSDPRSGAFTTRLQNINRSEGDLLWSVCVPTAKSWLKPAIGPKLELLDPSSRCQPKRIST
jgi:hypothetical protein